jgi:hypothetical protein
MTAKVNTIPATQNVNNPDGAILNATGTATVTVFTAGGADAILSGLGASSTDTVDRTVNLYINVGGAGTDRLFATILIPLNSGNSATIPAVDLLHAVSGGLPLVPWTAYDAYGSKVWKLKAGTTIKAAAVVTVTSGKTIAFFGDGADF